MPEERANAHSGARQAGTARQDRKDKSERLLLFVSTDNGAVMPGNIQTTEETFVRNGGIKSPWLVVLKGFNNTPARKKKGL